MFDAPYFSGRLRRSSVPSEAAGEGMTSYLLLSALALKKPERTGLSRFESVVASNPNVKASVSEAIIHIYYWFVYELGVHWNHQAGFGSKKVNIVSQCSSGFEQQRCRKAC